jgi:hypothetical protein
VWGSWRIDLYAWPSYPESPPLSLRVAGQPPFPGRSYTVADNRRDEEYDDYPTDDMVNDWNIHNDHAEGNEDGGWEEWEEAIVNATLGL